MSEKVPDENREQLAGKEPAKIPVEVSNVFSAPAYEMIKERIHGFISELVQESVKQSRRRRADLVSRPHVELASDYLIARPAQRLSRQLGTFGGILIGAALAQFLAMTLENQYTTVSVSVSAVLGVVGSFLVAFQLARD